MRTISSTSYIVLIVAVAAILQPNIATAQSQSDTTCRSAIAKEVGKYSKAVLKTIIKCHKSRSSGKIGLSIDCNDPTAADLKNKLEKRRNKLRAAIGAGSDRCSGAVGALAQFARCPSPAADVDDGDATTGIDSFAELAECLLALTDETASHTATRTMGLPAVKLGKGAVKCQREIGKGLEKLLRAFNKERARCQLDRDRSALGLTYGCGQFDGRAKISKAASKLKAGIVRRCNVDDDPGLSTKEEIDRIDACADSVSQLQTCVADVVGARTGAGLIAMAYELPDSCRAGSASRVINAGLGENFSSTALDAGWSGLTHGVDIPDKSADALQLSCDPDCATCQVSLDPLVDTPRSYCRCDSDPTISCDTINGADVDDCTGLNNTCTCYFGPPLAISSGGTPVCVVNHIQQDYSGTLDLGNGRWSDRMRLSSLVHLGISTVEPCPVCEGDTTANDGVRDGSCAGGLLAGTGACDVNGVHPTFGPVSLDCPPNPLTNISGNGLQLSLDFSNDVISLAANLPCDTPAGAMCPCRVCSDDTSYGCTSDADCAAVAAGTCTAGGGAGVQPNQCSDLMCNNATGRCDAGPTDKFCNGVLAPDGSGFIPCTSDLDCSTNGAGSCTISAQRRCYTDPITASGRPGVFGAQSNAIFCVPPTTSGAVNNTGGLPGPGRLRLDFDATIGCANEPSIAWEPPGGSNCTPVMSTTTTTLVPPLPCAAGLPPTCGGTCNAGEVCASNGLICECQPAAATTTTLPSTSCGDAFPACGNGACPAGESCNLDLASGSCICTAGTGCADTLFPICGGTCPAGQSCQGDLLGAACACAP